MSEKVKKIRVKQKDGSMSDYIPIGADAKDIDFKHNGSNVENTLKKKPYYFNNIEEMKNCEELQVGDMAITLGYYEANDGGGAKFLVREVKDDDTETICIIHFIKNNLIAEMIIENDIINFLSLGAKPQDKNNILYDNKDYLLNFTNFCNSIQCERKLTLFIPSGIYGFSDTNLVGSYRGFNIRGVKSYPSWNWKATIFVPFYNEQNYIIKIGNSEKQTTNIEFTDIVFSTAYFTYNKNSNSFGIRNSGTVQNPGQIIDNDLKQISEACLDILYTMYSYFDRLDFRWIKGRCFQLSSSWENSFGKLNFREVENYDSNIMNFKENIKSSISSHPNITATIFKEIYYETIIW